MRELLYYLWGRTYIETDILKDSHPRLLHISDTPYSFYSELRRLIKQIKPDYIVHTGDLVDNIKLEMYPWSLPRYELEAKKLMDILEASQAKEVYLCMGNHDDAATIRKLTGRFHIITGCESVQIGGVDVAMAHYSDKMVDLTSKVCLFGHNLAMKTGWIEDRLFLNGVSGINLLELDILQYYRFHYAWGIDDDRLMRKKIGL